MPFPFTQTLEGTDGQSASSTLVGCDSHQGTGTGVFKSGGIAPGTSSHLHVTNQHGWRNIVEGATVIWTSIYFRADDGNPSGDDAIILRHYDSGDQNLSGWQITPEGKIQLLAGGAPNGADVVTDHSYSDTRVWLVRHRDVRSTGRQDLWVHRDSGKLHDDLTADVRAGDHYRTEYGITNGGPTYQINLSLAKGSPDPLYFEAPSLDRVRWFAGTNYISLWFQVQGGPFARVTTGGPMAPTISDPVELDEYGCGMLTIPSLPLPGTTYTHLIDVGDGEDAWSPTVDVVTTKTQRGLS